jgi:hypothetical protein
MRIDVIRESSGNYTVRASSAIAASARDVIATFMDPERSEAKLRDVRSCAAWEPQADGSILVGYAAAGDVTLDGVVDVIDASDVLAAGKFNTAAPATWQQGDFNYDGLFDALDLAAMLSGGLLDQGSYVPAQHSAVAAVPEPAHFGLSAAAVALAWCVESRRRRSKRGAPARGNT